MFLKTSFFICLTTAFLPFGGLIVPLWILFRRHLLFARASLSLLTTEPPDSSSEIEPACKVIRNHHRTQEITDYFFSNVISHYAETGKQNKIFELLESTGFLSDQLSHSKIFGKSSDDIETYAVPAAIKAKDWNRFLHFVLLALHLRGTAEDILDFIKPLAQSGQVAIALDAVNHIASPVDRSGAKAMIASTLPADSQVYQNLLKSLPQDLASIPPLTADPTLVELVTERTFWMSIVVAQTFGLAAREALSPLLVERPVWWSDAVWVSMTQCHAKQHGLLDPDLWLALLNLRDLATLKIHLPEQLAAVTSFSQAEELIALVENLSDDAELSWLCRFSLLEAIAKTSAERAFSLWRRWEVLRPVYWSRQVTEQAAPFLLRLDDQEIECLLGRTTDPEVKVALLLAHSSEGRPHRIEEKRRFIEEVPRGTAQIHWQIRFLGFHARRLNRLEVKTELTRLARSLHEISYAVEISDLRGFLELIAAYFPERLKREMMRTFWAPSITPEALFEIAETTESEILLRHLLEKADEYLLPFRPGEAEAFQAWNGLLRKIVPRLCALTTNSSYLERAIESNPEQADELRIATVQALVDADSTDLARLVCETIGSRRLRHLTRLKMLAASDPKILDPASLFEAFADSDMVQDQIFGLKSVIASSNTPLSLLNLPLCHVEDHQDRYLTLLRVVERALLHSSQVGSQNEMLDRLVQSSGLVTSDAQLAALTPEITAIVASRSKRLAVTEIREALECLVSLRSVSWSIRRDICETLLARLLPLLCARSEKGLEAREAVRMISGLLNRIEYGSNQEIEERELLPVLYAVMDRLPLKVLKSFLKEFPSEHIFSKLYLADDRSLAEALDLMVEQNDFNPLVLETIFYLFSYRSPGFVPEILKDLTPGSFRDNIASNLLRYGWLPAEFAPEVLQLIEAPAGRMSTELSLSLDCAAASEEEELWLQTLASLMAHQLVDPTDPRSELWVRKLWTIDPDRSRPILARGVVRALAQAGRGYGTAALCLWLHAHLAPNAGNDPAKVMTLCTQAEKTVQRALTLSWSDASTNF